MTRCTRAQLNQSIRREQKAFLRKTCSGRTIAGGRGKLCSCSASTATSFQVRTTVPDTSLDKPLPLLLVNRKQLCGADTRVPATILTAFDRCAVPPVNPLIQSLVMTALMGMWPGPGWAYIANSQGAHIRNIYSTCVFPQPGHPHPHLLKGTKTNRSPMRTQMHREALWVQVCGILIRGAKLLALRLN